MLSDINIPSDLLNDIRDRFESMDQKKVHAIILWYEDVPNGSWSWNINWANISYPQQIALLHLALNCITDVFKKNRPEQTSGSATIQ